MYSRIAWKFPLRRRFSIYSLDNVLDPTTALSSTLSFVVGRCFLIVMSPLIPGIVLTSLRESAYQELVIITRNLDTINALPGSVTSIINLRDSCAL